MSWIKTVSGRHIDFINPDPDQIDLRDVATALSRNHRFAGHSPLKIVQHIVEVVTLMMYAIDEKKDGTITLEMALAGLIGHVHDQPEFAICDVATPLKRLLGNQYPEIEARLLQAFLTKWDLKDAWVKYYPLLKTYDQDAVEQEAIRFRLDGWFLTEEGEYQKVPNEWIPEDKVITLHDAVWHEDEALVYFLLSFAKLMIIAGREKFLPAEFLLRMTEAANAEGVTLLEYANARKVLPPVLIDGPNYF